MAYVNEPIAVVGSSCKFPGDSTSPSKLWELLKQPKDVSRKIDRFRADNWHNTDGHHHGASNVLDAYLLEEDPKAFDAQFFSISGGEADSIDPQQRVLLETVYEGIESAGLTIENLQGSPTAVYVGVMCDDYNDVVYNDGESIPQYAATGTARSILSNRVSYFFNWTGPSMTIDTACSSSLVGVHQAVQVLRSKESNIAVAAGSNLIFGPKMFIAESNLNMLSPNGKSRMWDADADGYARGEGVACVILKRLSDAIADGDNIECLIRETGVNQDGRTPGITMPSSSAQAALIRQTYAKAGLDPRKKSDRCQYFEAHGTGTKAGDPKEAGAIYEAFFEDLDYEEASNPDNILHVGSIKTVIGHTEGTAGLAGLLKASLAVQHKIIPPNMLFNSLNPDIEPFYGHLKIPTVPVEWPTLEGGAPRRVSVNSFGFGGTNAHAIIENYEPQEVARKAPSSEVAIPLVFSATSEKSLAAQIKAHLAHFTENQNIDLSSVAWTLAQRSAFNFRTSFSGTTIQTLCNKMEKKLEEKSSQNTAIGTRPITKGRGILGVFTGQGAQWAAMGRKLILASPMAEAIIDGLEKSLAELPASDRPTWSLKQEILALTPESRIAEGLMSQPLCTALQVVLVDLLRVAGITFEAVVGHSSGEIGAAYASGYIAASDAIKIAYYRGFFAKLSKGPNGENGSMLAVGTSLEDATELCQLRKFRGKLQVAACNSSASVTLSGNIDAAEHAVAILQDEGKFVRQLKVDTAYHSRHMEPCSEAYVNALKACNIELLTPPEDGCRWYSSVFPGRRMDEECEELKDVYWRDNMLKPVFFAQALAEALEDGDLPAIAVEVGPHPALKGPATQMIQDFINQELPYYGVLSRGKNDVECFADALGDIWTCLGPSVVKFEAYSGLFKDDPTAKNELVKSLPSYVWDHSRTHWYETRMSRTQRLRKETPHSLLGIRTSDEVEGEHRWRNYIKPAELPWLTGHKIQGQLLFPGSGFAVLALEAAQTLTTQEEIHIIEILDFRIHRALSFADEESGAETMFILSNIQETSGALRYITADFVVNACLNKDTGSFTSMASGKVVLHLGEPSNSALPDRPEQAYEMKDTDVEEFYKDLASIGYNYADMFMGITNLQRTADACSGTIVSQGPSGYKSDYKFHPAPFDVGFQAAFAAFGAPGDGRLWTLQIPTNIERIRFNPHACKIGGGINVELPFDAATTASESYEMVSDIEIYEETGRHCIIQVEGLHVSPLTAATSATDRPMFAETLFDIADPDASFVKAERTPADARTLLGLFPERCMLFYLKQVYEAITPDQREICDEHRISILNWAAHLVELTSKGQHPHLRKEWLADTYEGLKPEMDEWLLILPDFDKLLFVGERLLPFVRGEITMLEEFREHGVLDWFYKEAIGTSEYNTYLGGLLKQLSFRYPHMNVLEIGAGTGSATITTIKAIEHMYGSYTYTDISTGFFDNARATFKDHNENFIYQKLNIEHDITEQEFTEYTYDVIIASNVLHATQSLTNTLKNTRKLLKPGGYLVMLEVTAVDWLRTGFMFCGFADWWAGRNDGRLYTPTVTQAKWDEVFRETGFSGVDTAVGPRDYMTPYSVMLTQAVDAQISLIRQPLQPTAKRTPVEDVLVLGGSQISTFDLVDDVVSLIRPFASNLRIIGTLEELTDDMFNSETVILSLVELDEPVFKPFTPEKYRAMQSLTEKARNILWVSQGALGDKPYSNMMHGIARCLLHERSDSRFQIIDLDTSEEPDAQFISETLLRLHISDTWRKFATPYNPQWSFEREIYVGKGGDLRIARYRQCPELDDRYNSSRRFVRSPVKLDKAVVEIMSSENSFDIGQYVPAVAEEKSAIDAVSIRVSRSFLRAFKVKGIGHTYLVIGTETKTQRKVLALAEVLRSVVTVSKSSTVPLDVPEGQESTFLVIAANELLSDSIISFAKGNGQILIHEPTELLANAIHRQTTEKAVSVKMTSSRIESPIISFIHPSTSTRAIHDIISEDISVFVNLAGEVLHESIPSRIKSQISAKCKIYSASNIFSLNSDISEDISGQAALQNCYLRAITQLEQFPVLNSVVEIELEAVPNSLNPDLSLSVVNWSATGSVPVKVYPPEEYTKFKGDRTYLLVGLTGELGLSLCRWMIARGARYIALTSRNPKVSEKWLAAMQALGATVKVFAMDITNRRSLMGAYRVMKQTLPPIAGVCNGAMVLNDGLLAKMSYDTFNEVIRPKVEGTILLDELFPQNTLDFFMVFSSLTCVTGNIGQSPYAASNCFMVSLAEGRRKRGLAGSVINLAGIFGIGYINRTDKKIHERLGNMGYGGISEWDFQQFFAEAVDASRPDSGRHFEVSNGLKSFEPKDPAAPAWLVNSKFSRYVLKKSRQSAIKGDNEALSLKALLLEQTSEEGVYDVLLAGFLALLYQKLNMPPEENGILPESSLIELGVDSLVAVDVRTWFTKELGVEVQVLMLLGGASVATLIEDTAGKLDRELIPNVKGEEEATSESEDGDRSVSSSDVETGANTLSSSISSSAASDVGKDSEKDTLPSSIDSSPIFPVESAIEKDTEKDTLSSKPKLEFEKMVSMPYGSSQFWFVLQYLEDPNISNIEFRLELNSNIDIPRLEQAIKTLGQRHEALRTAFFVNPDHSDEPTLGVLPKSTLEFHKRQIFDIVEADLESKKLLNHTYDIERGEVARVILLSLNPKKHFLIFGFHHIAIDGFSFNLILNEMNALYEGKSLAKIQHTFSDWAVQQRREVESGLMSKELNFWRNELRILPEPLPLLPMAKVNSRRSMTNYEFEEAEELTIDPKTIVLIKSLCKRHKVSMFNFFLAIFKIFLFRFLDTERICIGFADAGRGDSNTHLTVGYLLNLLPLVFKKEPKQMFVDALKEARTKSFSALLHSKLPFRVLLDELKVPRSSTYSPLFQAFMDYRQMNADGGTLGAESSGQHNPGRNANDIILDISTVSSEEVRATFKVQKSLYSQESAEIMLKSYLQLVKTFALDSDFQLSQISLSKVPLYDRSDINLAENLAKGGRKELQSPATTSHLVEKIISTFPGNLALKDGLGNSLTYREMGELVDNICSALINANVIEGSFVGIFQEPTVEWICSLLAIWKVGAIYVPLDPRQSIERLNIVVDDCKPGVILSHQSTESESHKLQSAGSKIINVSKIAITPQKCKIPVRTKPYSPSTVLYTSGSTGKPKGVLLNHFGLLNHCIVYAETHRFGRENVLQQSAFSFDMAPYQTIIALYNGGSVYVATKTQRLEPAHIASIIADEDITCTIATPSEYFSWFKHGSQNLARASRWQFAISGGEAITHGLLREFRLRNLPQLKLLNVYGPSEISIGTLSIDIDYKNLDPTAFIPLGRPMKNYAVYIVDENFGQVPNGVDGEIVVAGAGVAAGYWNKPEMTKEKFLPDTISTRGYFPEQWSKLYRTGDIGRRQSDGSILFKGRAAGDTQVKLNGIRIELSDIENVIVEAGKGALLKAVCSVRAGVLVAHVEFVQSYPIDERQHFLKDLTARLPVPMYMSPTLIIGLDKMPLTPHGKVDRTAIANLSLPQGVVSHNKNMDLGLTETEFALKRIWEEVLPKEIVESTPIMADTDFFFCGGNSLNVVTIQSLIRERLHVSLPIVELLQSSVLQTMAGKVNAASSVAEIDWVTETKLEEPLFMSKVGGLPSTLAKESGQSVILTGSTGYLGRYILQQLVDDSRVSRIHCVAVRPDTDKPRDMLTGSSKIITHPGNLAEPMLGLSEESFTALAHEADTIIHNGANRSFWDNYHVIKGSNFTSTKTLVKLAATRKVPIHFISSAGVVALSNNSVDFTETSMASFQPSVDGSSGYIASKWASEVYIEKASKTLGLPLHIHRVMPSLSQSKPSDQLLQEFLDVADRIKVVPDWNGWSGNCDVINSTNLASSICTSAVEESLGNPGVSYPAFIHHTCHTRLEMAEIEKFINAQSEDRSSFEMAPPHEWVGKAKRAGLGQHFAVMEFHISSEAGVTQLGLKR